MLAMEDRLAAPELPNRHIRLYPLAIIAGAVLLLSASAVAQPPSTTPVIWEIDVELWENDGVTHEVVQSAFYGDYGREVGGTQMMDWYREHPRGLASGGVTATWSGESTSYRTAQLIFSVDNTYEYSHNGGYLFLIFGGNGVVRVTPWVRGNAHTRTLTRISHIGERSDGGVDVIGWVCGGGTWSYRSSDDPSGEGQWELEACDEAIMHEGYEYTKSRMTPSAKSDVTFARTGPHPDPFTSTSYARVSVVFDIEILDDCPALETPTATPNSLDAGNAVVLSVESSGWGLPLAVTGDLSAFGLSSTQAFDNPTISNLWQYTLNIPATQAVGLYSVPVTATDDTGCATTANIYFSVSAFCMADFDGSGTVDVSDIFAFLSVWFADGEAADTDLDGDVGVPDIFAFLAAWFAGCP